MNMAIHEADVFAYQSDKYAAARPKYPPELFRYLASLVKQCGSVWDCATGSGQTALGLSKYFKRVEATDISTNQIEHAFAHDKITYSVQSSEKTNFPDQTFDMVNVSQALHWFDLDKYWVELRRVLKPGGIFVATTYAWSNVSQEIDDLIFKYIREVIEPYWAPNNQHCIDGYSSIDFPFELLDTPEFVILNKWNLEQYFDYIYTWSATKSCLDAEGSEFFELAKDRVSKLWGNSSRKRRVITPLAVIAGRDLLNRFNEVQ